MNLILKAILGLTIIQGVVGKESGPTTTKGSTPDCQNIPDSYGGTVKSPGYPDDVPNGMDESCWTIGCLGGWEGILNVTSEVAYEIEYMCSNDFESSSEECEDKWPQKKCKKCNAKKCKKDKKCKKNCKDTCKLCDDRILAPTNPPSLTPAANCTYEKGPFGIFKSPGYPFQAPHGDSDSCLMIQCDDGIKYWRIKSNLIYKIVYLCNDDETNEFSSEECEDNWPQKKCKKCNAKKCKKDKKCKKNCQNTCDLCNNRILAPFY